MIYTILICIIAGFGAGFGTGLAGLSAAAVISPMLIVFLGVDPYQAVGIALASDVLASAVSAWTYWKNGNLDVKNALVMLASTLCFTLIGSWLASYLPQATMGSFSMFMTLIVGLKFIFKPVMKTSDNYKQQSKKKTIIQSILCGLLIGMICGVVGAGGGMMLLLVLTSVLGYALKTAVGTSVFIMTFTALTGAISHFVIGGGLPDLNIMFWCVLSTLVFAQLTARFANKASAKTMNRMLGYGLTILSVIMIIMNFIG